MQYEIRVKNAVQAALYECELKGQMSDGHWENSRPLDHWERMSDAKVVIDPENPGLNFRPKRSYNFAAKELIECIPGRMLGYARLAKHLGFEVAMEAHDHYLLNDDVPGLDPVGPHLTGNYWDKKREARKRFETPEVYAALSDQSYGLTELRKDLKELSMLVREARK